MSVAVNVTSSGPAARLLAQVTRGIQPQQLFPRIRGVARNLTRTHLARLDKSRPNRLGGNRTHFWEGAANATTATVTPEGVVITIAKQGMRQRFSGGTIRAGVNISRVTGKPIVYLAIPARAEAHGKRPGEFGSALEFAITDQGPALVRKRDEFKEVGKRRKDGTKKQKQVAGEGEVVFWLRKRVTQRPDSTVIPDAAAYGTAIASDLATWLNTLAARASASTSATA